MDKDARTKLREIIANSGWTQEELARYLNMPLKTVNFWLTGRSVPRATSLGKINELYINIVGADDVDDEQLKWLKDSALSKHLTVIELLNNPELLDKVVLYLTYHTNTIEGSTMTVNDVQEVLADDNKVLANKTAREQIEARNHRAALYFLLDALNDNKDDFVWTDGLIREIHLRLMNSIIYDAGAYRRHGVRIVGSHVATSNPLSIPDKVENLVRILNDNNADLIEQLAKTHAIFEQIHPFSDGNGRTGRLIMFIQALKNGLTPPLVIKERKYAYYKYLEIAQTTDNLNPLTQFIAESILETDKLIK